MVFSSKAFFVFLPLVLLGYHLLIRRGHKYGFLLAASWVFYAWCNVQYLWVILALTLVDYVAARRIEASNDERTRRRWLKLSIGANLGLLGFFKYSLFMLDQAVGLADLFGLHMRDPVWKILLPLGISFHTFQGIAYTVDVYRRRIPAVTGFVDFALFLSFFPQLVAGPIVRASEFLPQMKTPPVVTSEQITEGLHWFLCGLFKKLLIADWLGVYVADVYANPGTFGSAHHWWATLAWTAQIYCDFSAYSEMAIGTALWFGFRLPINFHFPYLASNIAEFWRRWHITLSTWLRDYLYYPLGGSRGGSLLTLRNLMITFLLCGLWHGASWNWLLFGLFHGVLMCGHRVWDQFARGIGWIALIRESWLYRLISMGMTFYLILVGMVLVRMETWAGFRTIISSLIGLDWRSGVESVPVWVPVLVTLVGLSHMVGGWREALGRLGTLPPIFRAGSYATAVAMIVTLSPGLDQAFIYFRF